MTRETDNRRKRGGALSPEEAALFDASMRDVKALGRRRPAPSSAASGSESPRKKTAPAPRPSPAGAPKTRLAPLGPGQSGDVDSRTLDRLRRGRLRPQARLDLHGMTQADAHRALAAFIGRAQASGVRCAVVITGKGRVSEGGGILRNQVPHWLNGPAIRPRILAFAPAQPQDGGAGALYVLLRRVR